MNKTKFSLWSHSCNRSYRALYKSLIFPTLLAVGLTSVSTLSAQTTSDVDALGELVREWTQLRRVTAEQKAEWKVEKVFLSENIDLIARQISSINERLEQMEGVGDETSAEIEKLDALKLELDDANKMLAERIVSLETFAKGLVERFPPPLMDTVEPLLKRIPAGDGSVASAALSIGERVQNVVGIVSMAEKFNTSLIYRGEVRELAGKEKQVWTLYWGLAASFSADLEGSSALVGYPSDDGWTFEERPELADTIVALLQTYDGVLEPQFIQTPAKIR